jgi:KaiC/GvpD/RAD55 family RecA-like ATPase
MKLVKTGIAGLDEFLTGGLPPKIILLSGVPGSGNDVFARQIAFFRAKQSGITYFTVKGTSDNVKEDMACFNWDTSPFEATGNWKFEVLSTDNQLVEKVLKEIKDNRTVIVDSLSELLLLRKTDVAISLLNAMSVENRSREGYHLLLLTEGMQDPKEEVAMQHFADGVISFSIASMADMTQRDLVVKKMRGSFMPVRRLPYSIVRRGFVLETATRIA